MKASSMKPTSFTDMDRTQEAPTDYSSWGHSLSQLLEGCIVEFPSKYIGRGLLHNIQQCGPRVQELVGIPGVYQLPMDAAPAEIQELYIPHNLFVMGRRPSMLCDLTSDPIECTPSGLKLKIYQRQSVTFLRNVTREAGGAILGLDAGLGKSITGLQALWLDGYLQRPGLIVGPLGARGVWCEPESDALRHYSLSVMPLEGTTPNVDILKSGYQWFFIHYDVLPNWQSWLFQYLRPASIIFDEIHYCMNPDGKRYKSALAIAGYKGTERRYGLTGTPIPKTRMDLFGQLAVVQPGQWSSSKYPYGIRYCNARRMSHNEGLGHWVFDGQTNTDELRARLAGVYLRFTKADVASDLPKLVRHRIDVTLPPDVQREYNQAKNSILKWMEEKGRRNAPTKLILGDTEIKIEDERPQALQLITVSALKSILDRGKLPQAHTVINDLLKQHRRLVVFTWKRDSAKQLYSQLVLSYKNTQLEIFGPIDGADDWGVRRATAKQFAKANWSVLVATRGSVGIAINELATADACLQVTPDWNPDGNLQAESRLHREGATSPEIHSYYMLAKNTLDDRVLHLIESKSKEATALAGHDRAGMSLASDLDPTLGDDGWSMEEICGLLKDIVDL